MEWCCDDPNSMGEPLGAEMPMQSGEERAKRHIQVSERNIQRVLTTHIQEISKS